MNTLSGPMFEPAETELFKKQNSSGVGAHYSLFQIKGGVDALIALFPDGAADELNFCLFSTSGVHGSYTTLEEIEASLGKYPSGCKDDDAEDYVLPEVTVVVVQPRICCLRYGNIPVTPANLAYLKKLRQSSWDATQKIGRASC